jgi:hypothetical protein
MAKVDELETVLYSLDDQTVPDHEIGVLDRRT